MLKYISLTKRDDFDNVFKCGKSYVGRFVVINFVLTEKEAIRAGLMVSKKMGNAVRRNRIRRLLKQAFREYAHVLTPGSDVVMLPRSEMKKKSLKYQDICEEIKHIFEKIALDTSIKGEKAAD